MFVQFNPIKSFPIKPDRIELSVGNKNNRIFSKLVPSQTSKISVFCIFDGSIFPLKQEDKHFCLKFGRSVQTIFVSLINL